MIRNASSLSALLLSILITGCPDDGGVPLAEGIYAPLGQAIPVATEAQLETFARGEAVALRRFTPEEGLGPTFNVTFCGGCHEKPVFGGSAGRYRNFLLVNQELPDGSLVGLGNNGVQPQFDVADGRAPTDPRANQMAMRNPIPFFGVGLLAEIPEEEILRHADPNDADGDGISGRPNFDRGFVGRFGRKAQTVSIEGFIRGPLGNHLGITSNPLSPELRAQLPVFSPVESRNSGLRGHHDSDEVLDSEFGRNESAQASAPDEPIEDDDGAPDPELSDQALFELISWAMLLAAPEPQPLDDAGLRGQALFDDANCSGCHVPQLNGPRGGIPAYSDLLLHDMGEDLGDGIVMGRATQTEFRTQPLWGITAVGPYLHDGRADTLDEAIRAHGGEAAASRDTYLSFSDAQRADLMVFLNSLGGADQRTDGLIPPGAEIPSTGLGAPSRALSESESQLFLEGRNIFDRDEAISRGLGPVFNGDSCRACHFEPAFGGAGPSGVDVIRHGRWEGEDFIAPGFGTISSRHATTAERPEFDDEANLIERRQTQSLFGLGLLEQVPESVILAGQDLADADDDGVVGVAHVLPDGRLGRFGWRADVPSIEEFVRDAAGAELGMTTPAREGLSYGAREDDDDAPDPEFSQANIDALAFFIGMLAPPERVRNDMALEDQGQMLFEDAGCGTCHSALELEDGTPVFAYTNLLLHDVVSEDFLGVPSFSATHRLFRTAPLWGVSGTAPYMHNGVAETLEDAIAAHAGEATSSRLAVEAMTGQERAALIAFLRSL